MAETRTGNAEIDGLIESSIKSLAIGCDPETVLVVLASGARLQGFKECKQIYEDTSAEFLAATSS